MSRVEWSAISGDEVETVVSNLMYNWNDRSQRIRPTQGDFGIDVLIPVTDGPAPWDVYQIKKYATNLTTSQKNKVVESFARMLIGLVREDLPIRNWYLVMPLDPTLDGREKWFRGVPEAAIAKAKKLRSDPLTDDEEVKARAWVEEPGRQIEWKGLAFCENLAADYPRVVDYYLHGGRDRLRAAVDSMSALIGGDIAAREAAAKSVEPGEGQTSLMEPSEVTDTLAALAEVLDSDPHYSYGFDVSPAVPELPLEPDLVAASQRKLPNGHCLTFKIYQRSAQSIEERPIPFKVEFKFENGSSEQEAIHAWMKYGKPFRAPGAFEIDLPGGLGGADEGGMVTVPAPHASSGYQLRMRIVDRDGSALAELTLDMTSTASSDRKGAWASGTEPSGFLTHEGYYDARTPDQMQRINFTFSPLAGLIAAEAEPAVLFARHLEAPNVLQISGAIGPFHNLTKIAGAEEVVPPPVARFVTALALIQTRTAHPIRVPDLNELSADERHDILRVGALLEGGTRVGRWDHVEISAVDDGVLEVGGHFQLQLDVTFKVKVDGEVLDLGGGVEQTILSAVVEKIDGDRVSFIPHLNRTVQERLVEVPRVGDAPSGKTTVRSRSYPVPYTGLDHAPEPSGHDS